MLTTQERRAAFHQLALKLDKQVETACARHWWNRPHPSGFYSGGYIQTLLAHFIAADRVTRRVEIQFLQDFHRHELSWTEEEEWIAHTVERTLGFASEVPEFIWVACRMDQREGTRLAPAMVETVLAACDLLAEADWGVDTREYLLKLEIQTTLLEAIRVSSQLDG